MPEAGAALAECSSLKHKKGDTRIPPSSVRRCQPPAVILEEQRIEDRKAKEERDTCHRLLAHRDCPSGMAQHRCSKIFRLR